MKATRRNAPMAVRQAARLLGVCPRTVHTWATAGRIAHFRTPGGHLRFRPQDIARFKQGRGVRSGSLQSSKACLLVIGEVPPNGELQAALRGYRVYCEHDGYLALGAAAGLCPDLTLVAASALDGLHAERYLHALHRATLNRGLYLVGDPTPRPEGVIHLADTSELRSIIERRLSTQRAG